MTRPIGAKACSLSNGKVFHTMKQHRNLWKDFKALQKCSKNIGTKLTKLQSPSHSQNKKKTTQHGLFKTPNTFLFHQSLTLKDFGNLFKTQTTLKPKTIIQPSILSKNHTKNFESSPQALTFLEFTLI